MTIELFNFSNLRTTEQPFGDPTSIRFYADVVVTESSRWPWPRTRKTRLRTIMRDDWDGRWRFVHSSQLVPSQDRVRELEAFYLADLQFRL